MQLNTKNFLIVLLVGVAIVCFYYGFRGEDSTTSTDTPQQTVSPETIESDTGKRLETLANSGSDWGMSPFGSGKPLTEEQVEEKSKFQKPNTEWKTRTISGVTYVFGEGNPKEVALNPTNIQEESRACELNPDPSPRICREGMYGYVIPEVEQALKKTLENPLWESLMSECEKEYLENSSYPQFQKRILAPQSLDISHFLIIDPYTRRKEIETTEIQQVMYVLISVANLDSDSGAWKNVCVEKYGKPLYKALENINELYSSNVALAIQQNRFVSP